MADPSGPGAAGDMPRGDRLAVWSTVAIAVPAIVVAAALLLTANTRRDVVEPRAAPVVPRDLPLVEHAIGPGEPDQEAPAPAPAPEFPRREAYSGPILPPRKDAVPHRVPKRAPVPLPEGPPPESREILQESLPYFRKKAEARAETLLKMGENLEKAKKPAASLGYYERVARDFPDTPAAKSAAGRIEALRGR